MDIRDLVRRQHTPAAQSSSPAQAAEATSAADSSSASTATATGTDTQDQAATTEHVSKGGRFMHLLQAFEDKHPEEAKRILNGIADKLRHDADHAGPFAQKLERWADKVQKAADTGDMSNLMPSWQPHAHHGMRAYQKAQEAEDAGGLDQVAAAAGSAATSSAQMPGTANTTSTQTAAASSSTSAPAESVDAPATSAPTSGSEIAAADSGMTTSTDSAPSATTPIIPGTPAAQDDARVMV